MEPCNECQLCTDITAGRALDVIEIDAASNRGIDEMRELRDKIAFVPSQARKKVFIIDEVHMLTKEAFNALLKTLEEPPGHALFVLATTELHKVPVTIMSRCQVFIFKKAQREGLVAQLATVAKQEGLAIDPDALQFLAQLAGGSYRDAISLLDQVSAHQAGTRLARSDVQHVLGLAPEERLIELVTATTHGEPERAVRLLAAIEADGADLEHLANQLIDTGRLLLHHRLGSSIELASVSGADRAQVAELAQAWTSPQLLEFIEEIVKARGLIKHAPVPLLPLEVVVVKLAQQRKIEDGRSKMEDGGNRGSDVKPEPAVATETTDPKQKRSPAETSSPDVASPQRQSERSQSSNSLPHRQAGDLQTPDQLWSQLLERSKAANMGLHALLRQAEFGGLSDGQLVMRLPFQFALDRLRDRKYRMLLGTLVEELAGQSVEVVGELCERPHITHHTGLSAAEAGETEPNPALLEAAAEVFELEPEGN